MISVVLTVPEMTCSLVLLIIPGPTEILRFDTAKYPEVLSSLSTLRLAVMKPAHLETVSPHVSFYSVII